jgi:ParB family chromosome partitioning protein
MPAVRPNKIEMIPISRITVLNPRARNKRQHREIVNNIEAIGLKRPITVSRRDGAGGPRYDLVCGEGRLEAFQMLGQTEIPAVVIEASESECLVMSLVENIARRTPRPIDLMKEIGALRSRGYNDAEIAEKIGVGRPVNMIASLLERGEERLVSAVETGLIPITWQWRFPRPRRKRRRTCSSTPMRPASSGQEARRVAACSTCGCAASARVDCLSGGWAERAPASVG